ncbi:TetR/AcrR family transcriptional regulator [Gordonia sp. N1V]|uniref:TetR/AcrR family transcriptional regulator n=1 Tax=Gordonia sp. N1V TaxID=3034163 RepID=UPI0023E17744|nr:TetR/AcrR family transcriptional regulator [Gordonia sp. N1V]MDF3284485.1 TetR/AcrR family transcriptional regulator [Gordonia sp. N1V]
MRTRGWNGTPPASDDEARERILDVARQAITVDGAINLSITDIARELGVTRQTVYRYFPSADAVLMEAALRSATAGFLDRLAGRLVGITDPAEAVVEGLATTLEVLPVDPYVSVVLSPGHSSSLQSAITSEVAIELCRSMLMQFDIDWAQAGFDDAELEELAEFLLRILQSFILDPGHPPRQGAHLRRYLRRWVSPAVRVAGLSEGSGESRTRAGRNT